MKQDPTGGGVHAIRRSLDRDRKLPLPRSWQVFPVDCLPSGLAGFVTEASGALGCDPAFVAAPLLAAYQSEVGTPAAPTDDDSG